MAFTTERELVATILKSDYLKDLTNKGPSVVKEEVEGLFGIPDIAVITTESEDITNTCAYEAKLKNWKRALFQAFRYKAFVKVSYVIMDHDHINPALSNMEKFRNSNVGLLSIDNDGEIFSHYIPFEERPYSPRLESRFNDIMFQ
ncbi:hypothetical protein [Methanolacinia petrolearia]|uniref:hypothetical protein n=1 Tax=Methanolacinia petrolearia TaxID=54120 RepID=UPI003BAB6DF7